LAPSLGVFFLTDTSKALCVVAFVVVFMLVCSIMGIIIVVVVVVVVVIAHVVVFGHDAECSGEGRGGHTVAGSDGTADVAIFVVGVSVEEPVESGCVQ